MELLSFAHYAANHWQTNHIMSLFYSQYLIIHQSSIKSCVYGIRNLKILLDDARIITFNSNIIDQIDQIDWTIYIVCLFEILWNHHEAADDQIHNNK